MNNEKLEKILAILDGKPNQRFRESYFIKSNETLTTEILAYTKELNLEKFPQKVWHWVNDNPNLFVCVTCKKVATTFNKNWLEGYRLYCSQKCSATNKDTVAKRKSTCIEVYGVDNVAKNADVKKKQEQTNYKVYGAKSSFQNEDVRNKWKDNLKQNKGVDHVFQLETVKKVISEKRQEYLETNFDGEQLFTTDFFKSKSLESRNKKTYEKYSEYFNDDYNFIDYKRTLFKIEHKKCGKTFNISLHSLIDRKNHMNDICLNCYPISENKSIKEKEIIDWLKEFNIDFIESDRSILSPKHLDIYIPSHKLAIEHNGLYHHSELLKDKNYHLDKTLQCQEQGIQLLHIWGDEWMYKKEIVKSMILNKLGLTKNRIYARQCEVRVVNDGSLVRQFLDNNHIQGYSQSSIKLGLFNDNKLVSLMTFGYRHTNAKKEFELIRFCNLLNTNVIGAASKLFKHFIKNYEYSEIISFADLSHFNGKMYETLGFTLKHRSENYWWVIGGLIRKHRFNYTKSKLIKDGHDPLKTGVSLMHEMGHYRIWGVGMDKWVYTKIEQI